MNPVSAGMCDDPATYPWSSCAAKTGIQSISWLDEDPLYLSLGNEDAERQAKYRDFLSQSVSDEERKTILGAVLRGQLTGGRAFVDQVESRIQRRIELRGQGRPRKSKK